VHISFDGWTARNRKRRLAYFEWKLYQADEQAALSPDNETLRSIRVWEAFEENAKDAERPECGRMRIAEEVRETLKEYREICCSARNMSAAKQNEQKKHCCVKTK
jgi:hypothetical protein